MEILIKKKKKKPLQKWGMLLMDLLGDWTQLGKKIYELEDVSIETQKPKK